MSAGNGPRRLRAAVSGCGGISAVTLQAAKSSPDFEVVALHDIDAAAASRLGDRFEIARRTTNFEDLLTQDVEFVILNSPNDVHAEHAIQALEAGKPVLVQKPMARTAAEALRMIEAAARAGLPLGVTMLELGRPLHSDLRALVAGGFVGEPVLIEGCLAHDLYLRDAPPTDDWRRDPQRVGGGAFLQLAVHHLALAAFLLDRRALEVLALSAHGRTVFDEETTIAVVRFEGGALGSFAASWATDAVRFAIAGTEGRIEVTSDRVSVRGRHAFSGAVLGRIDPMHTQFIAMDTIEAAGRHLTPALEVHGRFARWVRGGDTYPWPAFRALEDLRLLDAVAAARAGGRIEKVGLTEPPPLPRNQKGSA